MAKLSDSEQEIYAHGRGDGWLEAKADIDLLRLALEPFAKNADALSLAAALSNIGREDLLRARSALASTR